MLCVVTRSRDGVNVDKELNGPTGNAETPLLKGDSSNCDATFTTDGKLLACATLEAIHVVDTSDFRPLCTIPEEKVIALQFSPKGAYVVSFRHPTRTANDKDDEGSAIGTAGNLAVWRIADGAPISRCQQAAWPCLSWTFDEQYCVRRALGLLMLHDGALSAPQPLAKVDLELPKTKEAAFSISPSTAPLMALFKPNHKGNMGCCKIYRLPDVKEELLCHYCGQADSSTLTWNKSSSAVTVLYKTESDRTGQSYYGNSKLCVLNVREREAVAIPLGNGECVHDCQWSPTADEFIVVHGVMPRNKATLYNARGQPLYTFGEAPRNLVKWSPNGKLFVLGGSGTLAGEFQFYDRTAVGKPKDGKLGYFSEKMSDYSWSPCSRFLLGANVFSRLRVDNKYVVWKHNGERVTEKKYEVLWEAAWIPYPSTAYVERPLSPVREAPKQKQAYIPPHRSAAAAALLARTTPAVEARAGPVGACVEEKKKKRHK